MRVLYRADGGHPVGTGHLFRAIRLLSAMAEQGDLAADLLVSEDADALRLAAQASARVVVLPPRADLARIKPLLVAEPVVRQLAREKYDLVVVDMLDTLASEMSAIAACGVPLATFDDRGAGRRFADLIVNVLVQEPEPVALPSHIRLLEGGAYVTLSPIFAAAHANPVPRVFGEVRNVFVALGGADAAGLSVKVAAALRQIPTLGRVEFAGGPAFPHRDVLKAVLQDAPWEWHLYEGLSGLLDRYRWCDVAVVAGGLTMYEVCCTGTPSLAVCQPIDHQFELAENLSAAGAMRSVGYGLEASEEQIAAAVLAVFDPAVRQTMAVRGPALVDGRGTERTAAALRSLSGSSGYYAGGVGYLPAERPD